MCVCVWTSFSIKNNSKLTGKLKTVIRQKAEAAVT